MERWFGLKIFYEVKLMKKEVLWLRIGNFMFDMNPAEEYILNQAEPFRSILLHLQSVIERSIPKVELKYKYRIPFYYINGKPFCYLNQSKDYVDVGFWHAKHISIHLDKMTTAGRKMMKSLRYTALDEIDNDVLIEVLNEAYAVKERKFWG